ncbi:MAG TPA: ABC transporter ATP-binding protein [Steroidobacteraceae bacterium]|nr:ABC transporter ATP-binding protein [Steroidobacteraceae bacterium]
MAPVSIAAADQAPGVLSIENLSVSFTTAHGTAVAVREVSLQVGQGECLGVVGESGAGKSQLFLAALGLLPASGRVSGHARFAGTDLIGLAPARLDRIRGAGIGVVFQDPMTSLTPHVRIGDQIAEPLVRHRGLSWRLARALALDLLRQVQLTDPERRLLQYPHELSGGMRQRVLIAIALSCDPQLLIADEPTTALDVTVQAQILSLLLELKRSRGMSMVLITHDLGAVAGVADRVAVMRAGRIVESDTARVILRSPREPYTRALLEALPRIDGPSLASAATSMAPSDPPAGPPADSPSDLSGGPPSDLSGGPPALRITDVRVQFDVSTGWLGAPRTLHAVDDVSLEVRSGEAVAVVGESGSGKSTLARAALQLIRPQSGRVLWLGTPVDELSQRQLRPLRRDLQVIFQDPLASLDPRMTVAQIVAEPLHVHRQELGAAAAAGAVAAALQSVGLGHELAGRYPHELSGGQCQRVGIARAMVLQPRVLVCDEPVSALDVTVQQQILRVLDDLKRNTGLALLFISHNLAVVRQLCERVLVLYLGRMMEEGPVGDLFTQPNHPYTRALLDAVPVPDPDVQPGRLLHAPAGELPSPTAVPSGCVYSTRCPVAAPICREQRPGWDPAGSGRHVACHRWREVASHFGGGR